MKNLIDKVYENPKKLPWYKPNPPQELVKLIQKIKPCKVLDIGCGTGDYSIYLAKRGFNVIGVDISEKAIHYAKENAVKQKVIVKFVVLDALSLSDLNEKFDLILEWGLLHFIPFENRKDYVKSIAKILNKSGKYISFSFDLSSPEWGGGKIRKGIATKANIYYSSMDEIKELFQQHFKILYSQNVKTIFNNSGNEHRHNLVLLEKK